jgi:phosphoesterase RecJ-like protein
VSDYRSNASIDTLAERFREARRILVATHAKPDGDAVGSALVIAGLAEAQGSACEIWVGGPIDPVLRNLAEPRPIHEGLAASETTPPRMPEGEFDLVVVVDTGTYPQLEPLSPWLQSRRQRTIGFDHHARGDESVAALRVVDTSCASTTELLTRLVDALGVPLERGGDGAGRGTLAEAIFIGLATDTGWFRFASAGPRQFALAGRLLAAGADKDRLYTQLEQQQRPARLALLARALGSLERTPYGGDERLGVAVMTLSREDFVACGGSPLDTSGLVNEPLAVTGIVASVLLSEHEPGLVRASFRSSAAAGLEGARAGRYAIDVNELAARFGGGGHIAAAGARLRLGIVEARHTVTAAIAAG